MPVYRRRDNTPLPMMTPAKVQTPGAEMPPACQNGTAFPVAKTAQKPPKIPVGQTPAPAVRTPQARVLAALMPDDASDPVHDWPLVTRQQLSVRAGYTAVSGTVTRALNGIRAGSSSGDPHKGLLDLGCIETVTLDIDGVREVNYRVTALGVTAYQKWLKQNKKLPPQRDKAVCINERYKKEKENQSGD